jgi:5,10-methenyltetrahydromethanopterin hydrogenase
MSGTHPSRAPLSSYRDAVTDLLGAGEQFGDIEDAIEDVAALTQDEKAALWLFAFSLRDPAQQQLDARAHLAALDSGYAR